MRNPMPLMEVRRPPLRHGRPRASGAPLPLACTVLILLAIACSSTGTAIPEQPAESEQLASGPLTLPPPWTPTVAGLPPFAATVGSTPPTTQSVDGVGPSSLPENACDLVPLERVQFVMGEAVAMTAPAENTCLQVLASGTSVTAMIQRGDAARNAFIDPIAQLSTQEGCTLRYSYDSSVTGEPTPLPAEVEPLVAGKSLLELANIFLETYAAHCDAPLETAAGYGDLAFFQPLDVGFVETITLGVVIGDAYVAFTIAVADPQADPESAALQAPVGQEWLMSLAQTLFAPSP